MVIVVRESDSRIPSFEMMKKIQEPMCWLTCGICWRKDHDVRRRVLPSGECVCTCHKCYFRLLDTGEKE